MGRSVTLRGDGCQQVFHRCLLRCRCPALHRKIGEADAVDVPGVSARTLKDLAAYIYGTLLPWESEGHVEPKNLLSRVLELQEAARFIELEPLQRICVAWCQLAGKAATLPAPNAEWKVDGWQMEKLAQGMVFGSGLPGAVLEEDLAKLLEELDDDADMEDKITVILGRSDKEQAASCRAHSLVLCARSAFFATALDSSTFVERGRRQVHLGIVEDLGLWRPGEDVTYVEGAFRALLRHVYTGRSKIEARFAVDLLALLQGDFLQLWGIEELAADCEAAALDASLEEITEVITRANAVGFRDLTKELLQRLAALLHTGKAVRDCCTSMPQEVLVELLALVVEQGATNSAKKNRRALKVSISKHLKTSFFLLAKAKCDYFRTVVGCASRQSPARPFWAPALSGRMA
eukprot:Skav205690  [mRNA]  locus=scaffold2655:165004:166218:- [translate_table: standard]